MSNNDHTGSQSALSLKNDNQTTDLPSLIAVSSLNIKQDDPTAFYRHRANDFVMLHEQVQTSVELLDSLESFLSTFQRDLSAVSGQISSLQDRSKEIENRLKGRRKIERPLSNLISEISISPTLTEIILDSEVGEPWLTAIPELAHRLDALEVRSRVKATRSIGEVAEGLRIMAANKLRVFFLGMFQPIRNSLSTNIHIIQTSVFLKFRPLFLFLLHHASPVATEIQHAYIATARLYYETGFRRYIRALNWIKARTVERSEMLGAAEKTEEQPIEPVRLSNANIDGPSVTLAYMADNKSHKEPIEALFRSALLVLMDNGTAEYTFINKFFDPGVADTESSILLSPRASIFNGDIPSEFRASNFSEKTRTGNDTSALPTSMATQSSKEYAALSDGIWKQIMEPALEYCQTFTRGILDPPPPIIPSLTMIRLLENTLGEVQKRHCPPLETFILGLRLTLWPVFQKDMNAHVESVKKLVDGAGSAGFLSSKPTVRDTLVQSVAHRYAVLFTSFVTLTENEEETMIFSNLSRLRTELSRLIISQSSKAKDTARSALFQSTMYESLVQSLSAGPGPLTHPKTQSEIAYWREREEEARRRIASTRR
ncbi:Vps52-domain-containing protein [Hysterangium stoloniferum]|nr:Vps52-domain-containing protein [Hysterangium stoloniferum]